MIKKITDFLRLEGVYYLRHFNKKYYIIRRGAGGAGFFSNYMWVLGHAVFAYKLGYIPVVDMENYPTLYSEKESVNGEKNAWNYYFENVGAASLQEAYQSGSYTLGIDLPLHKYEDKYCLGGYRFPTEKAVSYYAPFIRENIRIRQELLKEFEEAWNQKIETTGQVLGVHIRGTDMKNDLGHPMPASVQEYLKRTQEILQENPEIECIFLATDEHEAKESFEEAFADSKWKLFINEAFRTRDSGEKKKTGVHELKVEHARPCHKYLLGKEVLKDAWFLSKCDYLLCGHSNISNVAIIWNENQYRGLTCIGGEKM